MIIHNRCCGQPRPSLFLIPTQVRFSEFQSREHGQAAAGRAAVHPMAFSSNRLLAEVHMPGLECDANKLGSARVHQLYT
jgi:hypothetical protein